MHNKTAIVFPGQGSQFVGMLDDVIKQYPQSQGLLDEASEAVGYDVAALISDGPQARLDQTEYTQVAMLVTDVLFFRLLQQHTDVSAKAMAGHSLGEYAALVCAGALDFQDAVRLVSRRGQLMQTTVPQGKGAMAAIIGLDNAAVQQVCQDASTHGLQVSPANYNSPGQVVIAGDFEAVEQAVGSADKAGAKMAKLIPVSVPCHCPLLESTASAFKKELEQVKFTKTDTQVLSNIDAMPYADSEDIRRRLAEQLYCPVQWVKIIESFVNDDFETVIECGPGRVLSGLVKRIHRAFNIETAAKKLGI